jgi:hypothetical protein
MKASILKYILGQPYSSPHFPLSSWVSASVSLESSERTEERNAVTGVGMTLCVRSEVRLPKLLFWLFHFLSETSYLTMQKTEIISQALVAHTYNSSYSGRWRSGGSRFETSLIKV